MLLFMYFVCPFYMFCFNSVFSLRPAYKFLTQLTPSLNKVFTYLCNCTRVKRLLIDMSVCTSNKTSE